MDLGEIARLTDAFGAKREERLLADKVAAKLKEEETLLEEQIIQALLKAESTTIAGSHFGVNLNKKIKPVAEDWLKIHDYIRQTDSFDLLQRRLTEGAVQARWEDGVQIPGVTSYPVYKLTVSKR